MSEQQPRKTSYSDARVLIFITCLSLICALILSILSSALKEPQEIAKQLDQNEQLLIAAKIMDHTGHFLMLNEKGEHIFAKYKADGMLVPGNVNDYAPRNKILEVFQKRIVPLLVNDKGDITTFKKAGINMEKYIAENQKTGYYKLPEKLLYEIKPNPAEGKKEEKPLGYVIPVNGFGLWDAIYGYIAIKPDGDTVIGISWYEQKETPGLGANIADAPWQSDFPGKKIFQENPNGQTDFKTAPVGITVIKGKVSEVLGNSPKAKSSVDGMPGATLTGNGVTSAYHDVLSAYRPFFIKLHQEEKR